MVRVAPLVALLASGWLGATGCLKPYCEADTDCQGGERCNLGAHRCEGRDGGVDARPEDGGQHDGGPTDGAVDGSVDSGCSPGACENPVPICDATSLECVACTEGPQCAANHPDRPVCGSAGCVECTDSLAHCQGGEPICDGDLCRACAGDSECQALGADLNACIDEACVECRDSATHCLDVGQAFCDGATHQCRPCMGHAECGHLGGVCDEGTCLLASEVLYVDVSATTCPGDGTPGTPFCQISQAVAASWTGRRVIRVADGLYTELNLSNDDVWIIGRAGGVAVEPATGGNHAVWVHNDLPAHQTTAVLEGLTLQAATGSGAGVRCTSSEAAPSLTLRDCTVTANGGPGVNLTNCNATLRDNHLHTHGSYGLRAEGSTLVLDGNRIEGNLAGGILILDSAGTLTNNLVVDNGDSGSSSQGGIGIVTASGPITLLHNTVADNLRGPMATEVGGIACLSDCGLVTVSSCLVTANAGGDISALLAPRYCFIGDNNLGTGQHNFSGNPGLVGSGDYRLAGTSICRGAAEPALGLDHDLAGDPRPLPAGSVPDVGAYEAP